MNILTSVGPGSVSHVGVSGLPHLHLDASTRTSSPSESKAVTSYPILVANKLASKYRFVASVHTVQLQLATVLGMLSVDLIFLL